MEERNGRRDKRDFDAGEIKHAVEQIAMGAGAEERILHMDRKRQRIRRRRRYLRRGLAAACAAVFISLGLCFAGGNKDISPWGIVVYAREADAGRQKRLSPGEKVYLEKVPGQSYYMLELDLPERYYYEKQLMTMGIQVISTKGNTICWYPEAAEPNESLKLPEVLTSSMYIEILDENWEPIGRLSLQVTSMQEGCYIELLEEEQI